MPPRMRTIQGIAKTLIPRVLRLSMVKLLTVSTVQEIRSAIHRLSAQERALLAAEIFALNTEPNTDQLEQALSRGLADVEAGRVRPVEEVEGMIPRWTSKS